MERPQTIYDHIDANNRKTWLLVALFPISLAILFGIACLAAVYIINDPEFSAGGIKIIAKLYPGITQDITRENLHLWGAAGYLLGALVPIVLIALTWICISYFFGAKMMLGFAGAKPLSKEDNPALYRLVENIAMSAGLPLPKIYIINDESLNAFATGRSPETASIAFTSGILQKLKTDELEAVAAHEMGHIGNRDIRLNMMIITGLSIFAFAADFLRLTMSRTKNNNTKNGQAQFLIFLLILALLIFNFIVAPLIRLAISRTREYAADASSALITRDPLALARALAKISEDSCVEILDHAPTMAVACIANPLKNLSSLKEMTATHPSIQNRIDRLRNMGYIYRG